MNPYVIDRSKLNLYIFVAAILIIASFFLGYFTAQYRAGDASSILESDSAIKHEPELQKDADSDASETSLKQQSSESDKSKDLQATKSKLAEGLRTAPAKTVAANAGSKPVAITQSKSVAQTVKKPTVKKPIIQRKPVSQTVRKPVAQSKPVPQTLKPVTEKIAKTSAPSSSLASKPVSSDKLKYSIQAGMFGSLVNANKFLDQLQTAGFDAYMEEHQDSDGAVRYNVRFGRFASRTEAEQRLGSYQQDFSTPAYVIINP